jgi:hypothetical protein
MRNLPALAEEADLRENDVLTWYLPTSVLDVSYSTVL